MESSEHMPDVDELAVKEKETQPADRTFAKEVAPTASLLQSVRSGSCTDLKRVIDGNTHATSQTGLLPKKAVQQTGQPKTIHIACRTFAGEGFATANFIARKALASSWAN